MKKIKLKIKTLSKNYNVIIGNKVLKDVSNLLKSEKIHFKKCLIIADKKVPKKFIQDLKKNIKCQKKIINYFESSEINKNYKSANNILNVLLKNSFNRDDCLISIGGGITGDVAGFAASIFKRGLKFINIPSTLLSQVDSSIGGKTGINNKFGKNLIGSFYQPDLVLTDISLLKSLPNREIICGYAEIFKHSLLAGKNKFNFLNKNKERVIKLVSPYIEKAIFESCKIKKQIVENDEKEKNLRKVLNLGHTFGHAYEATLNYSKKLNHGEAVILGIISSAKFSHLNKMLSKNNLSKIISHISNINFSGKLKNFFNKKDVKTIIKFMHSDKKNKSSKINLILLRGIGKPVINLNFNKKKIQSFLIRELVN